MAITAETKTTHTSRRAAISSVLADQIDALTDEQLREEREAAEWMAEKLSNEDASSYQHDVASYIAIEQRRRNEEAGIEYLTRVAA